MSANGLVRIGSSPKSHAVGRSASPRTRDRREPVASAVVTSASPRVDLRSEASGGVKRDLVEGLTPDERAAVEAATGELGNKPDAVKLGWLKMRTNESWTKQRY